MDFAKGKPLPTEGGQIGSIPSKITRMPLKETLSIRTMILANTQEDIFKAITLRYFKTAYPLIFKKKE